MKRSTRSRPGLSFLEVMMNLAIVSVLMLAVTSSLRTMLQQYRGNETAGRTRRAATVMMDYMLTQIRQAKGVKLGSMPSTLVEFSSPQVTILDPQNHATLDDDEVRVFRYDAASQSLMMSVTRKGETSATEHTVLKRVINCQFRAKPEYDQLAKEVVWRSVTVDLTLNMSDVTGKQIPATFVGTTYARCVPLS